MSRDAAASKRARSPGWRPPAACSASCWSRSTTVRTSGPQMRCYGDGVAESLRGDKGHGRPQPGEETGHPSPRWEVDGIKGRIAALLQANRGVEFCGECLGAALGASSDLVGAALSLLTQSASFREDQWLCFRCHRTGQVVRAI